MADRHVAVVPFPFTSHPISRLTLMCRLARAAPNVHFSFFSTSSSNAKLLRSHGDQLRDLENVKLYDVEDGIPPGRVVPQRSAEVVELFLEALPVNFKKAVAVAVAATGRNLTCLLADVFLSISLADLADELRVPWIAIWSGSPCTLSVYAHISLIRERYRAMAELHGDSVDDESFSLDFVPGLSGMCISDHWPKETITGDVADSLLRQGFCRLEQLLPRARAVALSSYRKLNPNDLNRGLESKFQALLNLGFLTISVPPPPLPPSDSDPTGCLSWLDKQRPHSVAYISFGTMSSLSEKELTTTAEALEESKVPFLWSLPDYQKSLLPNEFAERINRDDYKQGKILAWVNQVQVLGHGSTGVHVTHCGNNSVNESLASGVPMICRPFWADNFMNAKTIQNVWGVGVIVEGGVITKSGLIKALELVLGREEGGNMRERGRALKQALSEDSGPSGSAAQDFKALLELITSNN